MPRTNCSLVSLEDIARKVKSTPARGVTHLGINEIIVNVRWEFSHCLTTPKYILHY